MQHIVLIILISFDKNDFFSNIFC